MQTTQQAIKDYFKDNFVVAWKRPDEYTEDELQKIKARKDLSREINYATNDTPFGEWTLHLVYNGMHPLDSNTYQYVYAVHDNKNVFTGDYICWEAAYSSYDNGGPDGEIDEYNVSQFKFVSKKTVSVEVWE